MTKVTRLTLEQGGGLERRRLHLREISAEADAPLETIGQDLRAARLRKGEDLAAVSRALKIRKDHLEAVEEGNIQALPGRTYAIGFLRSYAEYLGLDPAQCVERLKAEIAGRHEDEAVLPQVEMAEERKLPHGTPVFLVLMAIAVVWGGYYLSVQARHMLTDSVAPVPDRLATEAGVPPKSQPIAPAPAPAQNPQPADATSATQQAADGHPLPLRLSTDSPAGDTDASLAPAGSAAADTSASAVTDPLPPGRVFGAHNANARVELRVHRLTRILVQGPDNIVYFNRTLRPGDIYRAPNRTGLTLTTLDGGAVEVILDGSSMGYVGKAGSLAEGLSLDPQSIMDHFGGARSG